MGNCGKVVKKYMARKPGGVILIIKGWDHAVQSHSQNTKTNLMEIMERPLSNNPQRILIVKDPE